MLVAEPCTLERGVTHIREAQRAHRLHYGLTKPHALRQLRETVRAPAEHLGQAVAVFVLASLGLMVLAYGFFPQMLVRNFENEVSAMAGAYERLQTAQQSSPTSTIQPSTLLTGVQPE